MRFIILLARLFGTHAVSDLVQALEGDEEETYDAQASPEVAAIAADEREHAEIWKRLGGVGEAAARATVRAHPAGGDGRSERWHRTGQSGTLRAVIFGVSDGLVSNLSLVMGVAGATAVEPRFILLAGIAGLLAGSFSMAAGEYISMQSQRELYERQIALERAELEAMPGEEEAELARIYRSKGFSADEAGTIAHRIFQDPEAALDTLIREELGLDPDQLGSPWGAAGRSFAAFAVGASIPVIPYLFGGGGTIFTISLVASLVGLFAVGAGVSLLTGRGTLFSGARQVLHRGARGGGDVRRRPGHRRRRSPRRHGWRIGPPAGRDGADAEVRLRSRRPRPRELVERAGRPLRRARARLRQGARRRRRDRSCSGCPSEANAWSSSTIGRPAGPAGRDRATTPWSAARGHLPRGARSGRDPAAEPPSKRLAGRW